MPSISPRWHSCINYEHHKQLDDLGQSHLQLILWWSCDLSRLGPWVSPHLILNAGLAFLFHIEDNQEKYPQIWDLLSHSSLENKQSPFSVSAFLMSCVTWPGSSFLLDLNPMSNLHVRYCLILSENQLAVPFSLWRAHPCLRIGGKGLKDSFSVVVSSVLVVIVLSLMAGCPVPIFSYLLSTFLFSPIF